MLGPTLRKQLKKKKIELTNGKQPNCNRKKTHLKVIHAFVSTLRKK
jgi:hypothetical protein